MVYDRGLLDKYFDQLKLDFRCEFPKSDLEKIIGIRKYASSNKFNSIHLKDGCDVLLLSHYKNKFVNNKEKLKTNPDSLPKEDIHPKFLLKKIVRNVKQHNDLKVLYLQANIFLSNFI